MSAWIVSKYHVDCLVKAADSAYPAGQPGMTGLSWWRTDDAGGYAGWRELNDYRATEGSGDDYKQYVSCDTLGQMLVDENVASVSYRYSTPGRTYYYGPETAATMPDDSLEDLPGPCDHYYMQPYVYEDPRRELTPGEVFRLIDCLDYQSCEHPTWRTSEVFAFLTALREAYCRRVDGYDAAPWGFEKPEVATTA